MNDPRDWTNRVYNHTCETMPEISDGSIATCVTSPPYFRLRTYGVVGQIGLEDTIEAYVGRLVGVFREVRRVLRADGTLWLNLGDSYAERGADKRRNRKSARRDGASVIPAAVKMAGIPPKNLLGIPWRVALALQQDGWILRDAIVWHKPNPMPTSVSDRCTSAYEMICMFAKSSKYFADMVAVRQPLAESSIKRLTQKSFETQTGGSKDYRNGTNPNRSARKTVQNLAARYKHDLARVASQQSANRIWDDPEACAQIAVSGANLRNVWTIATAPSKVKHAAMFPPEIPRRCIQIGSRAGDVVLDPFLGSGTTALAATELGRRWVGYELNSDYVAIIEQQIAERDPIPQDLARTGGLTQVTIFDLLAELDATEVA